MKVIIIGGGSAGVSAATHLRRCDENAEIIIIEKTSEFAVSTCGLPYVLSGKIKDKDDVVGATVAQMQRIFQIDVKLNTEVLEINPDKNEIVLSDNKTMSYDKLVIATGAVQLRPDIKGITQDNVFTLNSLLAAQRIVDYFVGLEAKKVVVLGAGYVGLRAAEALADQNAKVVVIENHSHILSEFDYDFANFVKQKLEAKGLLFFVNTSVKEFLPNKIILSNGKTLDFDLAIVATGNKNIVKLPILADIELGETGAIRVDEFMQTSIENIFACGESVELEDMITGTPFVINDASLVVKSAKIAADNVCEIKKQIYAAFKNYVLKVFDYVIGFCGANESELKKSGIPYHKLYFSQKNGELYIDNTTPVNCKLLFGLDGKILGLQIMGKRGINTRLNMIASLIAKEGNIKDLSNVVVAYFPEFAKAKDLINNLGTMAEQIAFEGMKVINIDEIKENDVLLNVCMPSNFRLFTKAKVINIPLPALRSNLAEIPRKRRIILSCSTGYTAYIAYNLLQQRGLKDVYLLNSPNVWQ